MIKMNKEIEDALHTLLHCSLKDTDYETQVEQYKLVRDYITNLKKENKQLNSLVNSCQEEIERLTKENQELKSKLELYENGVYFSSKVDEKDKQIDKLKEWINIVQQNKDNRHAEPFIFTDELDELLDILKEVE